MTYYIKKYASALASAKDYIAQWSGENLFADDALIIAFPTLARFDPNKGVWSIHIKAWLYLPIEGKKLKNFFFSLPGRLRRKIDNAKNSDSICTADVDIEENDDTDKQEEIIKSEDSDDENALQDDCGKSDENPARLGLFFVRNSIKVITKSIINDIEHFHPSPDKSGFIEQDLELSNEEVQALSKRIHPESNDLQFDYEIQLNESKDDGHTEKYKSFKCTIYVLAQHGISIISDIDDTIKISDVVSTCSLLKHTFYNEFKPVDGMSELYQLWHDQNCQFHYVSASPWQLYLALRVFLEKYKYPLGTMSLRKFAWNPKYIKPPKTCKIEASIQIINSYPLRKYICVGDSGELDPETYSQLYKTYPNNIAHIFIRDICKTPECLPTCQERYEKAFESVPKQRWTIFKDPKTIEKNIQKIISC